MSNHNINIDEAKCVGCGLCVKDCPAHNIKIENQKAEILLDSCIMCGHCAAVCPKEAISISGYKEPMISEGEKVRLNPDEILEVIRYRRTIRQFQDKEIAGPVLQQILEAGRLTHTAKNKQDVSFVVLDKEKNAVEQMAVGLFKMLKPLTNLVNPIARNVTIDKNFFFFGAPIVIVILADEKINGILAAQNMEFVAEANGLGVLFSGYFTTAAMVSRKIRKALKIPHGKKVAATLVLGYPKVKYLRSPQREPLDVTYL